MQHLEEQHVEHRHEQVRLVGEVAVDRGRADVQPLRQLAQAEVLEPAFVEQLDRGIDDHSLIKQPLTLPDLQRSPSLIMAMLTPLT